MKEKIKKISLILIIIGGLFSFYAQPTQAGFFDWLSWNRVKTIFIKEQIRESLPASISEPIKEIPSLGETIQETPVSETKETLEEIQPGVTSRIAVPEKIIYKDNPEQAITIQNLKNQIASLQNQIKNLEQQIEDLLSGSPEIKVITKEVPVEKIVVKEVIKEVPVEVVKEVIKIKEVPVEKIVIKEVLVPQICPVCQSCQVCSPNLGLVPPSPPVAGYLSIQEITVPPHQNTWKITASGESIQITDIVFELVDPQWRDIEWYINWRSEIGSTRPLNYRTCATAISYDQEFGTNWALPECLANPTNDFAQYRVKDWWGRDITAKYHINGVETSGLIPTLKDRDSFYIERSYANRPIKASGVGQTSGTIIELENP
ncbi:MAG: hypothetical protein HYW70_00315 [Candidatus Nealsonbacteria bacterium]|nr:hypothetical protein [Candidatus Nealsonbacteria bacterium]